MKCYTELPPMECLSGDTLSFTIGLESDGEPLSTDGYSMRLVVAKEETPKTAVLVKDCEVVDGAFSVVLTSKETADWQGGYELHLALYDIEGLVYRKIAGTLWVKPTAWGGSV